MIKRNARFLIHTLLTGMWVKTGATRPIPRPGPSCSWRSLRVAAVAHHAPALAVADLAETDEVLDVIVKSSAAALILRGQAWKAKAGGSPDREGPQALRAKWLKFERKRTKEPAR